MPALDAAQVPLPRIGHYRALRVLGEGGMGVVYEAEQENPRRTVALKVVRAGLGSPELLRRFEHEAQILGRLQHPGIAQVYEAGTADLGLGPVPYFAMELVRGQALDHFVSARKLATDARVELLARICDAVEHAHRNGVVHRDLKPGNILVDEHGQPKVLDFGIARATDSDLRATTQTEVGSILGTLPYMSPEQASGDPAAMDTRSDVYALGVILYELLAGRLPHDLSRSHVVEALRIIREDEAPSLGTLARVYRGDLETIAAKALEKDKERRYGSAAELAADLRRHLASEPIVARPASTFYQLSKFARRNRVLVGGIVAVLLASLAGTVVSTRLYLRAERARVEAGAQAEIADAVNRFLNEDLLASVDPRNTADREIRMRAVLDEASTRLDGRFVGQPLVEATLRTTIGTTYVNLGLADAAEPHLVRALELLRTTRGERHRATLAAADAVAGLREVQGRIEEAERLHRELFVLESEELGAGAVETLRTRGRLATILTDSGRMEEAEPELRAVLAGRRETLGAAHEETLEAAGALAVFLADSSRFQEAEPLYKETLALAREHLGPEHPLTLAQQSSQGWMYVLMRRNSEAEELLKATIEVSRRVLGDAHVETLTAVNNLAAAYARSGRVEEAEPLYRLDFEISTRSLGPEHPDTLVSATNLGTTWMKLARFEEAAKLLAGTVEHSRAVLEPGHYGTAFTLCALGESLIGLERFEEAEAALLEAHAMLRAYFGADSPNLDQSRAALVRLYELTFRDDEAAAARRGELAPFEPR